LGMVGGGGIGMVLWELIRSFNYASTCAVLLVIIIVVSLLDMTSGKLRKVFI
jgi:phosphonate transport system permease protein